jgi:hypothetical protein
VETTPVCRVQSEIAAADNPCAGIMSVTAVIWPLWKVLAE